MDELTYEVVVRTLRAAGCVFAEDEAALLLAAAADPAELERHGRAAGRRRATRGQSLGWAEFCGLRIEVDAGVFVPRRRTEFLAEEAARLARPGPGRSCSTCAAAPVRWASRWPHAAAASSCYAADVDPAAVGVRPPQRRAVGGHVHEGDLDAPLPAALRGRVDVLLANVPYVPTARSR